MGIPVQISSVCKRARSSNSNKLQVSEILVSTRGRNDRKASDRDKTVHRRYLLRTKEERIQRRKVSSGRIRGCKLFSFSLSRSLSSPEHTWRDRGGGKARRRISEKGKASQRDTGCLFRARTHARPRAINYARRRIYG